MSSFMRDAATESRLENLQVSEMKSKLTTLQGRTSGSMQKVILRWQNLGMAIAFDHWTAVAATQAENRRLSGLAFRHLYLVLAEKSYEAFKVAVMRRWQIRHAEAFWAHRVAREALSYWSVAAMASKALRIIEEKGLVKYAGGLVRRAMGAWRAYTVHKQEKRHEIWRASKAMSAFRLCLLFDSWHRHTLYRRKLCQDAETLVLQVLARRQRDAFCQWQDLMWWRQWLDSGEIIATQHASRQMAAKVLCGWRSTVARRSWCRQTVAIMEERRSGAYLMEAFGVWKDTAAINKYLLDRLQVGVLLLRSRIVAKTLRGWREAAHAKSSTRRLSAKALSYANLRRTYVALGHWRQYASEKSAMRQLLWEFGCRVARRVVLAAFSGWRIEASMARKSKILTSHIVKVVLKGMLKSHFQAWHQAASRLTYVKGALLFSLQKLSLRWASRAFAAWKLFRHRQLVKRRAALFAAGCRLSRALSTWKDSMDMARWARASSMHYHVTCKKVIAGWRLVTEARQELNRWSRLATATWCRSIGLKVTREWRAMASAARHLRLASAIWKSRAAQRRAIGILSRWRLTCAALKFKRRLFLTRGLSSWQLFVSRKRRIREAAYQATVAIAVGLLSRVFKSWRRETEHTRMKVIIFARKQQALLQAVRTGSVVARRRQREMFIWAFMEWRRYVDIMRNLEDFIMERQRRNKILTWRAWHEYAQRRAMKNEFEDRAVRHYNHALLARAVHHWQRTIEHSNVQSREKESDARAFYVQRLTMVALRLWHWRTTDRRKRRAVFTAKLSAVAEEKERWTMRSLWQSWKEAVEKRRWLERSASVLRHQHNHDRKQELFRVWKNYTIAMRREVDLASPFLSPHTSSEAARRIRRISEMMWQSPLAPSKGARLRSGMESTAYQHLAARVQNMQPALSNAENGSSGPRPGRGMRDSRERLGGNFDIWDDSTETGS
ncbi:unnamed protein product [Ostreobium quekettii]|uniref:Sfi1 spindle body domain-containing protein n=1 Tax=Ostreobium quekettii TaxID=121088 RepID=A0A8S1JDD1_9CHLO|nr:unnamed protein product [Ostreobium quekettii]